MKKLLSLLAVIPLFAIAQPEITLEDIYKKSTFSPKSVPGFNSMRDGKYYIETSKDGIIKKSFSTGETVATLVYADDVLDENANKLSLNTAVWNANENKILVSKDKEAIYRRSSKAFVYVYDLKTKKTIAVDKQKIMHATFSPDGNKVAFVKNNNLYFKDLVTSKTTQVTTDGKYNNIINGSCDWVYEEEFGFTKAFDWSSDSKSLAYYRFDESKVKTFTMTVYDSLYPTPYTFKYPKAGEANSRIEIYIYNIISKKKVKADIGKATDIYIPRIKWTNDANVLAVAHLDRLQRHLTWMKISAQNGKSIQFYNDIDDKYIEEGYKMEFINGDKFITTSERSGWNNIYIGSLKNNSLEQVTTSYDVSDILGVDEVNGILYFIAANPSTERHLYSYNLKTKNISSLTSQPGTHKITFNKDYSFYLDNYSTISTPSVYTLYQVSKETGFQYSGKVLQDNNELKVKMENYRFAIPELFAIKNNAGDSLNAWMLKPYNFDPLKKYPVLFCNYGGPGSQRVYNGSGAVNSWQQMLAQKGYIVVCVDNTGTGFKGKAFKKKTYGELGKYEIDDQIQAAKYMAALPYVDGSRIGHWGWSYGGFMSSLAITKGADVFKAAIAVAPVTNWRYYDNIYTERFMNLPQNNANGYDDNSPVNFTKNIKGKFLIIHGTGDDNVHYQNSVMMVDEMIKNNIDFESAYYPNKNHGISGGNTSLHLYRKMTDFILKNL